MEDSEIALSEETPALAVVAPVTTLNPNDSEMPTLRLSEGLDGALDETERPDDSGETIVKVCDWNTITLNALVDGWLVGDKVTNTVVVLTQFETTG